MRRVRANYNKKVAFNSYTNQGISMCQNYAIVSNYFISLNFVFIAECHERNITRN